MATLTQKQVEQNIRDLQRQGADDKTIQEYLNTVTVARPQTGRFRESLRDVVETGRELGTIARDTGQGIASQFRAGATGETAAPRAGFRMAGELFGGIGRAAGSLFTGAGKLLLGQKREDQISRLAQNVGQRVVESKPGQFVSKTASSLEQNRPELFKDLRAATQIVSGAAELAGGAALTRGARPAIRAANEAAEAAARTRVPSAITGAAENFVTGTRELAGDVVQSVAQRGVLQAERTERVIQGAVKDYADNIFTTTSNRRRIREANQNLNKYDTDVLTEMAKRGITPDIEDGKANFAPQIERLDAEIRTLADELNFELQRYKRVRHTGQELKNDVENLIRSDASLVNTGRMTDTIQEAHRRVDAILRDKGRDYLTTPELNEFKRSLTRESKVYKKVNPDFTKSDGAFSLARVARNTIEETIDDVNVRALNAEMARAIEIQHLLDRAGTPAVRGGRLGTMAGQATGAVIGTASNLPVLGPIIGATAGRVVAKLFQKASISPLRRHYLKKMARGYDRELNERIIATLDRIDRGEIFDIPQAELRQIQDDLRRQPYLLGPAKPGQPRQQTIGGQVIELGERGTAPRGLGVFENPAGRVINQADEVTPQTTNLLEEAKKYKSAEELKTYQTSQELYKDEAFQQLRRQADELKEQAQTKKDGTVIEWRKLNNQIKDIEEAVRQNQEVFRKAAIRQRDLDLRVKDPTIDKLTTKETDELIKVAKEYQDFEEFASLMRGSATQYGEYRPSLRKFVAPTSKRVSEIEGVDPNQFVTIYRGIDKGGRNLKINKGDFVTTNFDEAAAYTDNPANVAQMRVKVSDLIEEYPNDFDVDTFAEYGSEFIYQPGKIIKITDTQLEDIWKQANAKN